MLDSLLSGSALLSSLALAATGAIAWSMRELPEKVAALLQDLLVTEVLLHSHEDEFGYLDQWLAEHEYSKRAKRLRVISHYMGEERRSVLAPGPGWHLLWHEGTPLLMVRKVETTMSLSWTSKQKETIRLMSLGHGHKLRSLMLQLQDHSRHADCVEVRYWEGDYWQLAARRARRDLSTLCLDPVLATDICLDLQRFQAAREEYRQRGTPYRRGYAFTGPPGTGKTSLAYVLAGQLGWPLYFLNLGSLKSDTELLKAYLSAPSNSVMLIEDIDAARSSGARQSADVPNQPDEEVKGITLSGLLNCIDGVATPEHRLLIVTSNHPEKLDPALMRPGRVDRTFPLLPVSREHALAFAEQWSVNQEPLLQVPPEHWPLPGCQVQELLRKG